MSAILDVSWTMPLVAGFSCTEVVEKELGEVFENPAKMGIPLKGLLIIST